MSDEVEQNAPDGAEAELPDSPGDRLREARENKGLSLQDAGYALHVDQRVLAAMEADDFEHLGAPVFVRGHLRNYARYLGLDADVLVDDYEALAQPEQPDLIGARSEVKVGSGPVTGAWVGIVSWLVVLILIVLAGVWFYHHPLHRTPPASTPAATPDKQPAPQTQTAEPPRGLDAGPADDTGVGSTQQEPVAAQGGQPAEKTKDQAATPEPPSGAGSATSQTESQSPAEAGSAPSQAKPEPAQPVVEVTLDLSLHSDSWVEVYDASGERLYYDLAHAGSTVHVRGAAPLKVFLGDSPAVDVAVDGKPFDQSRFQHSDNTARFSIAAPASDAVGN